MPQLLSELDTSVRYTLFALANVILPVWTYKVIIPAKVGWTRFWLALPLFVLCYLVFTLFDYNRPSDRGMVVHCVSTYLWLAPWKLIALSLNRGPLVRAFESRSLSAFIIALLLNVSVAFDEKPLSLEKKTDDSKTPPSSPQGSMVYAYDDVRFTVIKYKGKALLKELLTVVGRVIGKIAFLVFLGYFYKLRQEIDFVKSVLCFWYLYGWVSGLQDITQFLSLLVLNIRQEENFNHPYLSDSFSDFWARRWNLVMAKQLRELCYEPIIQGRWIADRKYFKKVEASISRRLIGTFCTFLASACVHIIIHSATFPNDSSPWDCALVFLVSSVLVGLEIIARTIIKSSESLKQIAAKVPKILRILLFHIIMQIVAYYTLLPVFQRAKVIDTVVDFISSMLKIKVPSIDSKLNQVEL
eukprot:g1610.t1